MYYERHRPEQTLLYPIVAEYPTFQDLMAAQGRTLPEYVQREFVNYRAVAGWNTGFCGCAVNAATRRRWLRSVASGGAFAPHICARVGRYLERQGLLVRDMDGCMDAGGRATHGVSCREQCPRAAAIAAGR